MNLELLALRQARDLLLARREADEATAERRKRHLETLEEGTDDYRAECYEITYAQGRGTGLQSGINVLGDLIEAFRNRP